jgi:hypothetical protein
VREFLETHLPVDDPSFIQFDWLGPSPFHAEFEVIPVLENAEKLDDVLVAEVSQRRGYDLVQFYYDPQYFPDSVEAVSDTVHELEDEVGLFYRTVHARHREMISWEEVSEAFGELVEMHESRGLRSGIRRLLRSSRAVQDVIFGLTQYESIRLGNQAAYDRTVRNLRRGRVSLHLEYLISREVSDRFEFPVTQVREMVNLLESRRSKAFENLIILIASLIGGAIGALITLLIT